MLFTLAAISSFTNAEKTHSFQKRRALPPLPNNDTWYSSPENLTDYQAGDIIKWRDAPVPLSIDNRVALKPQAVYQVQYRTQNSVDQPQANVMTLIIPVNPNPNHLFAYAYFSDSASPRCNPSIAMALGPAQDTIFTKLQLLPMIAALNQGWIVSVADDGGPQASFPAGLQMAYATLDSIRAAKKSGFLTGLVEDPSVTLNGYSGGGITAAWAGEIHGIYAPELRIDGIALGGLVPDFVYLSCSYPLTLQLWYITADS